MRWVVMLMAVLVLAAGPARAAEQSYDIHVILELTGAGAFIGGSERRGGEFAEELINKTGGIKGRPLHLIFHDNQSNPQVSVQLADDVLATHPVVVFASTLRADCGAQAPLFNNGPVLYCYTPSYHPKAGSWIYSEGVSTYDLSAAGFNFFRGMGWKRVALLTSTDATGQDAEKNILEIAKAPENKDVQIVENVHFNTNDVSVSAQIERIKAANPQVLIAYASGTPVGTVFRNLQQAGLDLPVATTAANEIVSQMEQFAAFLPKRLYFFSSPWPAMGDKRLKMPPATAAAQKEFGQALADHHVEPDQGLAAGWEVAMLVSNALRKLGPDATAAQLQDYLQHLTGLAGISGLYDFDKRPQRGLSSENALVTTWDVKAKRFAAVSELGGAPIGK